MSQAITTSVGKLKLPDKMLRAYKHSTNENRLLFQYTYERLTELGLSFYPTNCPDLRVRHPQNNIVFVTLWFQEVAGTRIEIRVDACPSAFLRGNVSQPRQIKQYDANSKARWAVYRINCQQDLEDPVSVIKRIMEIRPEWGN